MKQDFPLYDLTRLTRKEKALVVIAWCVSVPIAICLSYLWVFYGISWVLLNIVGFTDTYIAIAPIVNPNNPAALFLFFVISFFAVMLSPLFIFGTTHERNSL